MFDRCNFVVQATDKLSGLSCYADHMLVGFNKKDVKDRYLKLLAEPASANDRKADEVELPLGLLDLDLRGQRFAADYVQQHVALQRCGTVVVCFAQEQDPESTFTVGFKLPFVHECVDLESVCNGISTGIFVSADLQSTGGLDLAKKHAQIFEATNQESSFPDGVTAWQPFENLPLEELMDIVGDQGWNLYLAMCEVLESLEVRLANNGIDLKGLQLVDLLKSENAKSGS